MWLARRFPLERATWTRSGPAHLAGVFAATLAHVTFVMVGRIGIEAIYGPTSRMTWLEEFQQMFFLYFDWEMMTYWTIVGLSHAVRYHYEAQSRALARRSADSRVQTAYCQ